MIKTTALENIDKYRDDMFERHAECTLFEVKQMVMA